MSAAIRDIVVLGTWFCFAGPRTIREKATRGYGRHAREVTYVVDMCGAPPGVRCSCGSQLHGHDPGDEDARP